MSESTPLATTAPTLAPTPLSNGTQEGGGCEPSAGEVSLFFLFETTGAIQRTHGPGRVLEYFSWLL